jgi:hypothetical protein
MLNKKNIFEGKKLTTISSSSSFYFSHFLYFFVELNFEPNLHDVFKRKSEKKSFEGRNGE